LRRIPARIVGIGFQPEHVGKAILDPSALGSLKSP
jgi:hypothetical protein